MFLRFAYSPSFETGWAVGVQIDVQTVVGSDKEEINGGFVFCASLKRDAYVRSLELLQLLPGTATPSELEQDEVDAVIAACSKVVLTPSTYPWASVDGALSTLSICAGDSSLSAEWNGGYSSEWKGLEELCKLIREIYNKYH